MLVSINLTCLYTLRRGAECIGGQAADMITDVGRPGCNQRREALLIQREQRSRGLLKSGQIAGHGRHKPVTNLLCPTDPVVIAATGMFHQLAQATEAPPG